MKPRVAAIGLDAAEWGLVEQMIERGELPNLARLKDQGVTCRFRNGYASRAGLAWTQFLVGREVNDRREWNTMGFDPDTYEAYSVPAPPLRPFYVREPELRGIIFDVPSQAIVDGISGAQVTAWGGHSPGYPRAARPAGLLHEIDNELGPHPGSSGNDLPSGWHRSGVMERITAALVEGAHRRIDVLRRLQDRVPDWELLVAVMSETHSAGEYFWHGVDPNHTHAGTGTAAMSGQHLLEIYRALDDSIGQFAASLPESTTLLVFSVHGMMSSHGDTPSLVLLPELLHRLHFGGPRIADPDQEAWRRAGFPPVSPPGSQEWGAYMSVLFGGPGSSWRARALEKARRAMPEPLVDAARMVRGRLGGGGRGSGSGTPSLRGAQGKPIPSETESTPEEIGRSRSSLEYQPPGRYREFRPQMRAFALPSFSDGYVRVNLEGRERDGVVPLHEYEQTLDEIETELRACVDPRTGEPVVKDVLRARADNPMDPDGAYPDLVVGWSHPIEAFEHPLVGMIGPFPLHRTGTHTPNGFAFITGPDINPADLGTRSVLDLPPTILALLGREVDDLEGTPLPVGDNR